MTKIKKISINVSLGISGKRRKEIKIQSFWYQIMEIQKETIINILERKIRFRLKLKN